MPTILSFAQGAFASNRIGVRAPSPSLMPGLQLWWFPRISLAASPNQAPGGPALSAVGGGGTFTPTYVTMPGSQTTMISFETNILDAANATLMCVARTSAPARLSGLLCSAPGTAPNNGTDLHIYNVGNSVGMYAPPLAVQEMPVPAGTIQNWGFYAMRQQSGVGVNVWAKTQSVTTSYPNATAHTVGTVTYRIGMANPTTGAENAGSDIAFAAIVSGATIASALADAMVEQCYQSVKYSLSLDGISI